MAEPMNDGPSPVLNKEHVVLSALLTGTFYQPSTPKKPFCLISHQNCNTLSTTLVYELSTIISQLDRTVNVLSNFQQFDWLRDSLYYAAMYIDRARQ